MSKIKTTNKYIKAVWKHVYRCGYCDLQYIMRGEDPVYYNKEGQFFTDTASKFDYIFTSAEEVVDEYKKDYIYDRRV